MARLQPGTGLDHRPLDVVQRHDTWKDDTQTAAQGAMIPYVRVRLAAMAFVPGLRVPFEAWKDPSQAGFDFHAIYERRDARGRPQVDPATGRTRQLERRRGLRQR